MPDEEKNNELTLWERVKATDIWLSVFRHSYEDTDVNRIKQIKDNVWLHIHPQKVKRGAVEVKYTWCAGGVTFLLFVVTVVTGVVLMFYYRPTAEYAYADMKYLDFDVPLGMFIRNMHRWAAHAMVIFVLLHMFRVFITGSYKPPRQFNWVVGVFLLVMTLFLGFTGYLLPWDQLSMWAVTVGTNMAKAAPFIGAEGPFSDMMPVGPGRDVSALILGGSSVSEATLLRFYVLHCVVVPIALSLGMALHFWRIRKDGGISGPL